tara:strand:- start:48 stop:362 length:315 start_codon:yes stop_codon:yes gene_type:complete
MNSSFEEVKLAMKVILSVDSCAQVKIVDLEWCRGNNGYTYISDGEGGYESFTADECNLFELDSTGFIQMLDDHSHCGGYTVLLPYSLEIKYQKFKDKYTEGSLS